MKPLVPLILTMAAVAIAPVLLWSQCQSSLTYAPTHPVSGQLITFDFTVDYVPGYIPPQNAFTEQLWRYDYISGPDLVQMNGNMVMNVPSSVSFPATPFYAGPFSVDVGYQQQYAFGIPYACTLYGGPQSGGSDVTILVAPSGQPTPLQAISLKGQYVFQFKGSTPETLPTNKVVAIGSFTADGQGHIVSGVEDLNSAQASRAAVPILGESYTVDGATGMVEIITPIGSQHFDFFTDIDTGSGISNATLLYTDATPIGSGTLTKQSPFEPYGNYFVNFQGEPPADAGLRNAFTPASIAGLVTFSSNSSSAYLDVSSAETGVRKGVTEQGTVGAADTRSGLINTSAGF